MLLALPWLDAMQPVFGSTASSAASATPGGKPRRVFAICNNLGLLPDQFFPKERGRGYALSPYLECLKEHRDDFTVFSGVSHPDVDGGHPADNCFLTAAPHPGSGGFRNTISLDQYIAERRGHLTRYPSLTLGVNVQQGLRSLSWTGSGVLIPCEEKASDVFRRMFLQGTKAETEAQLRKLELGPTGGRVHFLAQPNVDPMSVIRMIQSQPKVYAMDGPDKLRLRMELPDAGSRLRTARGLLTTLARG